jgi:hypothetical protein
VRQAGGSAVRVIPVACGIKGYRRVFSMILAQTSSWVS